MVSAIPTQAKEWRGINPMKSTCDDVKRILGVTTCNPPDETYDLGSEKVRISFSKTLCFEAYKKFWNVPLRRVISIERHLKKPITISELGVATNKYKITSTDVVGMDWYSSEEDGLWFEAFKEWVQDIYYVPTKDDERLYSVPSGKC
jgi:hypothetical protein